jgi:hypothetical protein
MLGVKLGTITPEGAGGKLSYFLDATELIGRCLLLRL